ncbi:MAG: FAD:protein FMN transferase, partial [Solirubrobacterales bacterium]
MFKLKRYNFIAAFLIVIMFSFMLTGCNSKDTEPLEETEFMLGTICTIKIYDHKSSETMTKAFDRIRDIENKMSVNKDGTEVDAIDAAAGKSYVKVSEDTLKVIKTGKEYSEKSGGKFDITIGPLVKLWGIGTDAARVPSQSEIDAKNSLINYKDILINETDKSVMLAKPGMALDLGGIAKGYSADEVARVLRENNVKHAIINLGGNVIVLNENVNG